MSSKGTEILEELRLVLKGRTLDALLPPLFFVMVHGFFSLKVAAIAAFGFAAAIVLFRLVFRQAVRYALGGLAASAIASGFALLSANASSYFLPTIVGNGFMFLLVFISLIVRRPLAAWLSHLTRGWDLEWFKRKDIRPAYTEVTWAWSLFLLARLLLQLYFFFSDDVVSLFLSRTILGTPATLVVLVLSYLYGIWRLRRLQGPGIEEFRAGKKPPWKGQTRGF